MKVRDLIINLLKHDIDLDVFLVNGNDLMSPSVTTDAVIERMPIGTPPKFDETKLVGLEALISSLAKKSPVNEVEKPNAVLIMWM